MKLVICTCVNDVLLLSTVSVEVHVHVPKCMWESPVYIETFIHKQTMNQTTLKKGSPRFCTKSPTYCTNIIKGVGVGLDSSGLLINVVRIFLCHPFIHVPFYMQGFIQGEGGGGLEFPPPRKS